MHRVSFTFTVADKSFHVQEERKPSHEKAKTRTMLQRGAITYPCTVELNVHTKYLVKTGSERNPTLHVGEDGFQKDLT